MKSINANVILLAVGVGLLLVSLAADVIGIGDNPGFGYQQVMGTIAGVILTAIAIYLITREADSSD